MKWLSLTIVGFFLSSFSLFWLPPGLDKAQSIGSFLNGTFPSQLSTGSANGMPYQPVFPNITFDSPLTFNETPDGKLIVGQRDGKIYWFDNTPSVRQKNLMLDLSSKVGLGWDSGFLGMALHPRFGTSGFNYFYVYYGTKDGDGGDEPSSPLPQPCIERASWNGGYTILARYEVNAGSLTVKSNSETIMVRTRHYNSSHYGGGMLFGQDGFLYLTTGDQAQHNPSQNISNNLDGGVLRIDVDKNPSKSHAPIRKLPRDSRGPDEISGVEYWIPNDNPFLGGDRMEEYFSIGHRNPHRMTMDAQTGKMYIGEVGSNLYEEINVVKKGGNFGWPVYEGLMRIDRCVDELYQDMVNEAPLTAFPRSEANSITGGYVYRGSDVPELFGRYICADWGGGEEIWSVDINTGSYEQIGNFTSTDIISFGQDKQNELYILKMGVSTLFKMVSANPQTANFPKRLSETSAFKNLTTLEPANGVIEYDLIESFWSDGAVKKRWMAIPNDGNPNSAAEQIQFSENGDWQFPVGSVLIKHFELPIDERNPSNTRRLETRFSVKANNGNFYFLTYKWNAAGTDAELLETGTEENYTVTQSNGSRRTQKWIFPSRTDCLTCHNQASGGTLGPRTRNLNKSITYNETGINANQLVTLSHIGILNRRILDADVSRFLTHKAIDDPNASLEERARSYLDLNCAYCHRPGTGNRGDFDLRLELSTAETGLLVANANQSLGLSNEGILKAGSASSSILHARLNSLDENIKMPPLAKNRVDDRGSKLIADWINQLPTSINEFNIALNKPATQSSTFPSKNNFDASNAVDGNTVGTDESGSITHTQNEANAWWRVDLESVYDISTIRVYNRTDCCPSRLNGAVVYGGQTASTNPNDYIRLGTLNANRVNTLSGINQQARYILIRLEGSGYLTLAEVEVTGKLPISSPPSFTNDDNIALNKPANQSSIFPSINSFDASNAVDGSRVGTDESGSITHTQSEANAWWRVDLGAVYDISSITVYNRTDCCSDRLNGAIVYGGQTNNTNPSDYIRLGTLTANAVNTLSSIGQQARYIMIRLGRTGYLTLAEVEVRGTLSGSNPTTNNPVGPNGLQATYFDNIDLTGTSIKRVDKTINFNWGTGSPNQAIADNTYSARWEGFVQAPTSQSYTFYTNTDDGVRLWVNGQLIIDKWINQAPKEWTGTINLTSGQKTSIKMEYYENGGGAVAQLSWSSPSTNKQIIPSNNLSYESNTKPEIPPTATATDVATLYFHCGYNGQSIALNPGEYSNLNDIGFPIDQLSSVRVQPGYQVILYDNENFSGGFITLTSDFSCLIQRGFNDKAASIKVTSVGSGGRVVVNKYEEDPVFLHVDGCSPALYAQPTQDLKSELSFYNLRTTAKEVDQYVVQYAQQKGLEPDDLSYISAQEYTQNFKFVHDQPSKGNNYYRIKIEYADGSISYTPYRDVAIESSLVSTTPFDKINLKILPNPTKGQFSIFFNTIKDQGYQVVIMDVASRKQHQENILGTGQQSSLHLNSYQWEAGIYFVLIKNNLLVETQQFIVVK